MVRTAARGPPLDPGPLHQGEQDPLAARVGAVGGGRDEGPHPRGTRAAERPVVGREELVEADMALQSPVEQLRAARGQRGRDLEAVRAGAVTRTPRRDRTSAGSSVRRRTTIPSGDGAASPTGR